MYISIPLHYTVYIDTVALFGIFIPPTPTLISVQDGILAEFEVGVGTSDHHPVPV